MFFNYGKKAIFQENIIDKIINQIENKNLDDNFNYIDLVFKLGKLSLRTNNEI